MRSHQIHPYHLVHNVSNHCCETSLSLPLNIWKKIQKGEFVPFWGGEVGGSHDLSTLGMNENG